MTDLHPLWLYFVLVAGIVALPGMDMAMVTGSTVAHGRRAGFAALAGIVAGGVAHVALGVAGLGLLLQAWPALFNALLLAGAAYVAWLAWGLWRAPALTAPRSPGRPARQAFASGALTCLLNPKAYLFGVAVFPQFLPPPDASAVDWWGRALGLAAITAGTQVAVYGGLALLVGRASASSESPRPHLQRGVALLLAGTAAFTLAQAWRA